MSDKILVATEENGALALRRKEPLEIESLNDAIQIAAKTVVTDSSAELLAKTGETEQVPYNFRTSGGAADIGDRETDMIVGGTLAWNQLFPQRNLSYTSDNLDVSSASDGKWVATIRGASSGANITAVSLGAAKYANHKMLLVSGSDTVQVVLKTPNNRISPIVFNYDSSWTSAYINVTVRYADETTGTFELYPMLIDLTQMFGTTIADYIYSLEQANAGDGVAWFRKLFPKPYYAYDAGSLQSVNASSHDMVGFNAAPTGIEIGHFWNFSGVLDTSKDAHYAACDTKIPVIPGQTYCVAFPHITGITYKYFGYFDANDTYIDYKANYVTSVKATFTVPSNAHWLVVSLFRAGQTITTAEISDFCVNLSWDGERDGEYEPYQAWNYPLDDSLTLRGIPKLDANNKLHYDGDEYFPDGTVNRNWVLLDLGSVEWVSSASDTSGYSRFMTYDLQIPGEATQSSNLPNIVCAKYVANTGDRLYTRNLGITLSLTGRIVVYDPDYAQGALSAFKAAMSGVYVIYKAATPTTETADPYTGIQVVSDWGTEEYTDSAVIAGLRDVAIPVGHETFYHEPLRKKIENLPKDFSTLIADTEKATATRNYTAGEFLIVRNQLYKVTANIANGGTITPGVNVTATTVAEQITALWAAVNS